MALDNGSEASTKTTLEAVKQNVLNLCSTERGERVMQPNLGLRLRHYLFEPFSHDLILEVKNTIAEALKYWLPFILINDINVRMSTIIGFVGGGGIGFLLQQWINLLKYNQAGTALFAIAIVVITLDTLSSKIREQIR